MVFYGGIVAQRKQGFQSSFRGQPGRRRRKALLPGNGQRKGRSPSFGSLPGGMEGYIPAGDEGCDGPADLAPTLGVHCLRRSEERSDAPQAQPPPSKFHFEIWDAGYGIRIPRPFVGADACIGPRTGTPGAPAGGGLCPAPSGAAGYSDDRVGADLCVRPLPRRVQDSLVERNLSPAGWLGDHSQAPPGHFAGADVGIGPYRSLSGDCDHSPVPRTASPVALS